MDPLAMSVASLAESGNEGVFLALQELLDEGERVSSVADRVLRLQWQFCKSLVKAVGLEDGVPAERVVAARFHDLAIAAAGKDERLSFGSLAESEDALGVRALVLEVLHHLPEALAAHASKEVLATGRRRQMVNFSKSGKGSRLTCRGQEGHCRR